MRCANAEQRREHQRLEGNSVTPSTSRLESRGSGLILLVLPYAPGDALLARGDARAKNGLELQILGSLVGVPPDTGHADTGGMQVLPPNQDTSRGEHLCLH